MTTWPLDPTVAHLNHGSFGASPAAVLAEQQRWRDLMESNPVRFFATTLQPALDDSRNVLARFVGADSANLVFVPNATAGINAVFRSLEPSLRPGDEILITDHAYNACRNIAEVAAMRTGAHLIEVPVPFPLDSTDQFTAAVLDHVSSTTKLVMIDWVTSPTALVVPVAEIVEALEPTTPVLVDAAHAPGMVPIDLEGLGASYAVGNCHKWMCAPKTAGFIWSRSDRHHDMVPATISHGWNTEPPDDSPRFHHLFDWTGTDDPTAKLSVPTALGAMAGLHTDGWDGIMARNRALALRGREIVCDALEIPLPTPNSAIGAMATIPLPGPVGPGRFGDLDPLTNRLRTEWAIEVPVFSWRNWPQRLLRLSGQLYNTEDEYRRLAEALSSELHRPRKEFN